MNIIQCLSKTDVERISTDSSNPYFYTACNSFMYYFSASHGYIQYYKVGKQLIVIGNPHAKPVNYEEVLHEFFACFAGKKMHIYFLCIDNDMRKILKKENYHFFFIGYDAILTKKLDLTEGKRKSLRRSLHIGKNHGLIIEEITKDINETMNRLPHDKSLHFVLDSHTCDNFSKRLFVAKHNNDIISYVLYYKTQLNTQWNIKLFGRCDHHTYFPEGVDFILISSMLTLLNEGYGVNLGIAPLLDSIKYIKHPVARLLFSLIYRTGIPKFYTFSGLNSFKMKYKPDILQDQYLAYSGRFPLRVPFILIFLLLKKPRYKK